MSTKMDHFKTVILISLMTVVHLTVCKKPNILLMIADDLGMGDVGCFGNTTLRTPNIDSIAEQGVKLNHHLTASSLCTPSRAAFLTGRYPIRSGMVSRNILRVGLFAASTYGLPTTEVTFAKLAKQAGYTTGLIGKWHQGWNKDSFNDFHYHPCKHGFDYFYGLPLTNLKDFGDDGDSVYFSAVPYLIFRLISVVAVIVVSVFCLYRVGYIGIIAFVLTVITCVLLTSVSYLFLTNLKLMSSMIYRNYDLVEQPIDLVTQMRKEVAEGQEFLQARKADDKPFLLVMSWIHSHTHLSPAKEFLGKSKHGKYGDSVEELDWAVGEILQSLTKMGFADNTFVYFTSDNGGHLEERNVHGEVEGGYNGIYKGGKGQCTVDGGIRVPTVVKWPGKIQQGRQSNEPTSLMDVLPTVANIMNVPVPSDRQIDGKDLLPLLKGQTSISEHEFMFHYCANTIHAVRYRPRDGSAVWKLALTEPNYIPGTQRCEFVCDPRRVVTLDPPHLYDMTSDPGENRPIKVTEHPQIYQLILTALEEHKHGVKPAEEQLTFQKLIWRPTLQMCCNNNYPTCECQDEKFRGKFSN